MRPNTLFKSVWLFSQRFSWRRAMEIANFVSRTVLLEWINNLLEVNVAKVPYTKRTRIISSR